MIPGGEPCKDNLLPYTLHWLVRGIIFNDPRGRTLQRQFTPISASHLWVFIFQNAELRRAWLGILKNKNPAASCGSKLSLRREGDSNPRYSYPYGSLANCWFKPLTHLSSNTNFKIFLTSCATAPEGHPYLQNRMTLLTERDKSRKTSIKCKIKQKFILALSEDQLLP
jgi:hypothetical protein